MICEENEDSAADYDPDDAEVLGTGTDPQLSVLSLNGLDTANTMKLFGKIASQPVKVMIDSGANYCFISEQCAQQLELPVTPTSPYSVVLGDGSTRRAAGICKHVPLILENEEFVVSCYVFPLRNIDVILGVAWLASLGYVMANWQRSSMDFRVHGRPVSLKGELSDGMTRPSSRSSLVGSGWGRMRQLGWTWRMSEDSSLSSALRTRLFRRPGQLMRSMAGGCTAAETGGSQWKIARKRRKQVQGARKKRRRVQ